MTPGIHVLLGAPAIVALATPLPVIFPTALTGALAYRRRGELDTRAAAWLVGPGLVGAALGAWLTDTSTRRCCSSSPPLLLGSQAIAILRDTRERRGEPREATAPILGGIGAVAGFASGLLGHRRRARDGPLAGRLARDATQARSRHVAARDRRARRAGHDRPRGSRPHRRGDRRWRWPWERSRARGWEQRSRWAPRSGRSGWSSAGVSSRSRSPMPSTRRRRCWVAERGGYDWRPGCAPPTDYASSCASSRSSGPLHPRLRRSRTSRRP